MELSPEERQRIYLEENARLEAQTSLKAPVATKLVWWKLIFGVSFVSSSIYNLFWRKPLTGNSFWVVGTPALEVFLLVLGAWLIYSGIAPLRHKKRN